MLAIMGLTTVLAIVSAAAAAVSVGCQIKSGKEAEQAAEDNKTLAAEQQKIEKAKQGEIKAIQKKNNKESLQEVESEIASSVAGGYLTAMVAKTAKSQKDQQISLLGLGSNVSLSSRPEGSPVEV